MIEDDFTYVLRKSLLGHGLSPAEAAVKAGLPESDVLAFSRGHFSADIARKLAPVLGLQPEAFATHPDYEPTLVSSTAINRIILPFGDDTVNAWLIHHGEMNLLFDAGDIPGSCIKELDRLGVPKPDGVFITHPHGDHITDIPYLTLRGVVACGWNVPGTRPVHPGETLDCGLVKLRTYELSGHAVQGLGYFIEDLPDPIFVVGDALFAGSIGGSPTQERYRQSLETLRSALKDLPRNTILLPGHGPATRLSEELARNPFL
ncbi:MAG: MBL fold metallo-hydrolase [Luteolibacter sp.]